jgi:hypothetical protein
LATDLLLVIFGAFTPTLIMFKRAPPAPITMFAPTLPQTCPKSLRPCVQVFYILGSSKSPICMEGKALGDPLDHFKTRPDKEAATRTFYEIPNLAKLDVILSQWEAQFKEVFYKRNGHCEDEKQFFASDRDLYHLLGNYRAASKNGLVKVVYDSKNAVFRDRWYAKQRMSLQMMPRVLRQTLASDTMLDWDFVNCQPTILQQLAQAWQLPCASLDLYNNQREDCLAEIQTRSRVSRDDAKAYVIAAMNGFVRSNLPGWVEGIAKETDNLCAYIKTHHADIWSRVVQRDNEKRESRVRSNKTHRSNYKGISISMVYRMIESACLDAVIDGLKQEGYLKDKVAVLSYDGIMTPNIDVDHQVLTRRLEEHVRNLTGFLLRIKLKPMGEAVDIPIPTAGSDDTDGDRDERAEPEENLPGRSFMGRVYDKEKIVSDDAHAAECLYLKLKDRLATCKGFLYAKTGIVWVPETSKDTKKVIDRWLMNECHFANFVREVGKTKEGSESHNSSAIDEHNQGPPHHRSASLQSTRGPHPSDPSLDQHTGKDRLPKRLL